LGILEQFIEAIDVNVVDESLAGHAVAELFGVGAVERESR
jgi:hypothetical protein